MSDLSNCVVMVVDDTPTNVDILLETLGDDYLVSVAMDGETALEDIAANPPNLVLLDIMMPGMNGYEVCRRLKQNFATKDIPVIFVTAKGEEEDETKGLALGAIDYIIKPFSPAIVKARVRNYLRLGTTQSELRIANEKLKNAAIAAENESKAKSEFLAGMSHEIRTPMNGVIAAADLALSEKSPEKIKRYLNIIHSSGYALLGIINDILDFSKIEAGKLELEHIPFKLYHLITEVTNLFIVPTSKKKIEFLVDIDSQTPVAFIGDPLRLKQIITNLLSNAIKFTPENGIITLGVKASLKNKQTVKLHFFVKDTGIGIKEEQLKNLFSPFNQAETSTTREYGGTGLGLSISKYLVELMQGEIWVESRFGMGTTFHCTIQATVAEEERQNPLSLPNDLKGLKVLVVDDCPDSRIIIKKILLSFGYEIITLSSGHEAIEFIKADSFDLILMDWMMPGMDGIEASRIIIQEEQSDIPIIMMTIFDSEEEKENALKTGIKGFLTKPIDAPKLFDVIMDTFGKEIVVKHERQAQQKASIYKHKVKGLHVLLAEDNKTNQEIAKAVLEGGGIVVDVVDNGIRAIEAIEKQAFDAVLMDIEMPKLNGYDATKLIRQDPRFKQLPIIAMTAHAMKGDEEKCLKYGMNGYTSKPINQENLFKTLYENVMSEKRFFEGPVDVAIADEGAGHGLPAVLPGINIQSAMEALGFSQEQYLHVLFSFYRMNTTTLDDLNKKLGQEDWEGIRQIAHSLKGSSVNIGAEMLSKSAYTLESACNKKSDKFPGKAFLKDLAHQLNVVLGSITRLF